MAASIRSAVQSYIHGIQFCHFWPKLITMSVVAICFTFSLLAENPDVKTALKALGFFGLAVLGLKKNT